MNRRNMYYEEPQEGPVIENTLLVSVPAEYVPFTLASLEVRKARSFWKTDLDYSNALQGLSATQWGLLMNTAERIEQAVDRVYRLLDTTFNGTQYEAQPNGTVTPPIDPAPPASTSEGNALRAHVGRLWTLAENAHTGQTFSEGAGIEGGPALPEELSWTARMQELRGLTEPGIFGIGAKYAQLKDLLNAGRINKDEDQTSITDAINTITQGIDAGTDVVDIFQNAQQFLKTLATDGGLGALQLMAMAGQLRLTQRIIRSLDGGQIIPPTDNLMFIMRGDELTSSTNNILTYLKTGLFDPQATSLAQLVVAANSALATLNARVGAPAGGVAGTVNGQLLLLRQLISSLDQRIENANSGDTTALQQQKLLLECICEALNGPPSLPTYPDPAGYACTDYPNFVLQAQVTFDANGQGTATWVEQAAAQANGVYAAQNGAGFGVTGGRTLCFSLVWPVGSDSPAGGAGGNFTPFTTSGEGDPARPSIVYEGGVRQTEGTFWNNSSDGLFTIAYGLGISLAAGVTTNMAARIYVYSGAFG